MNGLRRAAVVGASGQMGGLLVRDLAGLGLDVDGLSRPYDTAEARQALGKADLVILCVPVTALPATLKLVVPHLSPPTILADVTSVKVLPMKLMTEAYSGPVIGTHPLFGPVIPEGHTPRTAVTPAQGVDPRPLMDLFERAGYHPFPSTPEEHDRALAFVQGLNFTTTVAFMAAMRQVDNIENYVTPSLNRRLDSAHKMLTQDTELFATVSEANPYIQETVRQFRAYLSIAAGGDLELLADHAQWWWRRNTGRGSPEDSPTTGT